MRPLAQPLRHLGAGVGGRNRRLIQSAAPAAGKRFAALMCAAILCRLRRICQALKGRWIKSRRHSAADLRRRLRESMAWRIRLTDSGRQAASIHRGDCIKGASSGCRVLPRSCRRRCHNRRRHASRSGRETAGDLICAGSVSPDDHL
jgi:hypothetical protein